MSEKERLRNRSR